MFLGYIWVSLICPFIAGSGILDTIFPAIWWKKNTARNRDRRWNPHPVCGLIMGTTAGLTHCLLRAHILLEKLILSEPKKTRKRRRNFHVEPWNTEKERENSMKPTRHQTLRTVCKCVWKHSASMHCGNYNYNSHVLEMKNKGNRR